MKFLLIFLLFLQQAACTSSIDWQQRCIDRCAPIAVHRCEFQSAKGKRVVVSVCENGSTHYYWAGDEK